MFIKKYCSQVNNYDCRNFKMSFPSEIGKEPNICIAEVVKRIKTRQQSLTSPGLGLGYFRPGAPC